MLVNAQRQQRQLPSTNINVSLVKSIKPSFVGKKYILKDGNELIKRSEATITHGQANCMPVSNAQTLVKILEIVTERDDYVLCLDGWKDAGAEQFEVVTAKEMPDGAAGVVTFSDGSRCAARTKVSFDPGSWCLLDSDTPPGMPHEWATLDIAERLALWEAILPGISAVERVEYRGSSSRVHKNTEQPGPATHAIFRISDPEKIDEFRTYIKIKSVINGLSFQSTRYSTKQRGAVVGYEHRTMFDLAVFITGRLVFCGKPDVSEAPGFTVSDAGITVINKGAGCLDISNLPELTPEDMRLYHEHTGHQVSLDWVNNGSLATTVTNALTMDSLLEVKGKIKPIRDWLANMAPGVKLRCEAPLRESSSEAAFLSMNAQNHPFVYDIGTNATYYVSPEKSLPVETLENKIEILKSRKGPVDAKHFEEFSTLLASDPGLSEIEIESHVKKISKLPGAPTISALKRSIRAKKSGKKKQAGHNLPSICINAGFENKKIDLIETALFGDGYRFFDYRDEMVSLVIKEGKPLVIPVTPDTIRYIVSQYAYLYFQDEEGKQRSADLPVNLARTLCARRGHWPYHKLKGFRDTPFLRPDYSIVSRNGYDPVTGMWLHTTMQVDERTIAGATPDDAVAALGRLRYLFQGIPWLDAASESVALSMVLTAVSRDVVDFVPMHAVTASTPGSGKSYAMDVAHMVAYGCRFTGINLSSSAVEQEKELSAAVLNKHGPTIVLNNVNRRLKGSLLEQLITEATLSVRPLGTSQTVDVHNDHLVWANGNNLQFTDDMTRRVIMATIKTNDARPAERDFGPGPHPLELAEQYRQQYWTDAMTIIKAYRNEGSPDMGGRHMAGFQGWVKTVRDALMWLGMADCTLTCEAVRSTDEQLEDFTALMECVEEKYGGGVFTIRELVADYEKSEIFGTKVPPIGSYDAKLVSAIDGLTTGNKKEAHKLLAYKFRTMNDRVFGKNKLQNYRTKSWRGWRLVHK